MSMSDLFIRSYKKLEQELITLSDNIYFCDAHIDVYSRKIVELTLSCGAEIEAISKEVYCRENLANTKEREQLKFDFDCFKWFIENWKLDLKEIRIAYGGFNFTSQRSYIYPLDGAELPRKDANCAPWKIAYMAAKHNRVNEFSECTLYRFIEAMATLYLLNLVFAEDIILIEDGVACYNEYDSLIFHAHSYNGTHTKKQVDKTCVHEVVEIIQQIDNGSPYGYVNFIEKRLLRLSGFETINMERQRNKREETAAWHHEKYGF